MAIIKQGGFSPNPNQINTTMGMRANRPPLCWKCRERREGELYGIDPNGQPICETCQKPAKASVDA